MAVLAWFVLALNALGILIMPGMVGRPREPIGGVVAAICICVSAATIVTCLWALGIL